VHRGAHGGGGVCDHAGEQGCSRLPVMKATVMGVGEGDRIHVGMHGKGVSTLASRGAQGGQWCELKRKGCGVTVKPTGDGTQESVRGLYTQGELTV